MIGDSLALILNLVFPLFGALLLLRAWAWAIRLHPHNPYLKAIFRLTDWLVRLLRRILPTGRLVDLPSLTACGICAVLYVQSNNWTLGLPLMGEGDLTQMPVLLLLALITVLTWACNLVIWGVIIQAILSWVNPLAPVMPVLHTLTAPLLNPIRRFMPHLGGLDFSPLVLIVLAQIIMGVLRRLAIGNLSLF